MIRNINGEYCVSGWDACDTFIAGLTTFFEWRKEGMPYIVIKEDGRKIYFYPVKRCQAWFRGEYDDQKKDKAERTEP